MKWFIRIMFFFAVFWLIVGFAEQALGLVIGGLPE